MKTLILILTIAVTTLGKPAPTRTVLATCSGTKTCKACKNCKYCKNCSKSGGTCGVCK